ncbi:hypothetical protein L1987_65946 [Smallanthus sonchifolius]|uniref:Uncharacterized protein n=1 Tax=Smallanthus sonchifolius TaxID=185202 RepID=A0ACB9BVX9_9ASTR|nr:hypothetical protein L1987_65946 [Smallanthus sonchifolius]
MESNVKNVGAASLTPSKPKPTSKSKMPENVNPNVTSPNLKPSNSPAVKSAIKIQNSDKICSPSPKKKIRERKFVVAKKNSKRENNKTLISVDCKCKAGSNSSRCLCVAYETLRASQEDFFKNQSEEKETETENPNLPVLIEGKSEEGEVVETSGEKRIRDKLLDAARQDVPEPGSGRVMHLVKAFENILTLPKANDDVDKEQEQEEHGKKRDSKWEFSSSSFCTTDLLLTAENLGLHSRVSSSLDSNHGSILNRTSNGGRQSRRNSSESSSSFRGGRWKRRTARATSQQPFKLRTEQRGRSKQEEFMKKVQEMMIEQEKQRIPIAQGLPWTTDEPECLVKPPVKEITKPVDLVLHSDVRAVERAEFDNQVQEKLSLMEQYRLERERLQKMEEEEELRRLRKELVPKAQPMPYFDRPFIPRRSEKQPTIPKEPKFHNHPQHKKIKCCSMSSWSDMYAQCQ